MLERNRSFPYYQLTWKETIPTKAFVPFRPLSLCFVIGGCRMLALVTVIAQRISRPGEDVSQKRERIMNWTRGRVLLTYEDVQPGRGAVRLFEHGAIVRAAVLDELTNLGLSVATMEHAQAAQELARIAAREFAEGDKRVKWLDLIWVGGSRPTRGLPDIRIVPRTPQSSAAMVVSINLMQLFKRISWSPADEREDQSIEAPKRPRTPTKKASKAGALRKPKRVPAKLAPRSSATARGRNVRA